MLPPQMTQSRRHFAQPSPLQVLYYVWLLEKALPATLCSHSFVFSYSCLAHLCFVLFKLYFYKDSLSSLFQVLCLNQTHSHPQIATVFFPALLWYDCCMPMCFHSESCDHEFFNGTATFCFVTQQLLSGQFHLMQHL